MRTVKLLRDLYIVPNHYAKGDVVEVPDVRAADFIRDGIAEAGTDAVGSANTPFGKHADVIWPEPPGGNVVVHPVDALAPVIADNPGLLKLSEVSPEKVEAMPEGARKVAQTETPAAKPIPTDPNHVEPVDSEPKPEEAKAKKGK